MIKIIITLKNGVKIEMSDYQGVKLMLNDSVYAFYDKDGNIHRFISKDEFSTAELIHEA